VTLITAYYVDKDPPGMPEGGSLHGMSDADLWQRISTGGNVLGEMTFDQAVRTDPRRIDALIQQRVVGEFLDALDAADTTATTIAQHAYLQGYTELRDQHGQLSAPILATALEGVWEDYRKVLQRALWPMAGAGRAEAQALQQAIVDNAERIHQAFTEATTIAARAAGAAASDEDKTAWRSVTETIARMWEPILSRLEQLEVQDAPPLIETPEDYGAGYSDFHMAGQRPAPTGIYDYRRMGGRVF